MGALKGLSPATIFAVALGIFFIAALVPTALNSFFAADTANFDATSLAIWALIPLAIIAAVVMVFIPRGGKGA